MIRGSCNGRLDRDRCSCNRQREALRKNEAVIADVPSSSALKSNEDEKHDDGKTTDFVLVCEDEQNLERKIQGKVVVEVFDETGIVRLQAQPADGNKDERAVENEPPSAEYHAEHPPNAVSDDERAHQGAKLRKLQSRRR